MQLAVHANDRNTRNKWGHARVVSVACTMYPMFYMCTDDDYGTIVTSVNPCLGCPWLYFSGRTGHDRNEQSLQTCITIVTLDRLASAFVTHGAFYTRYDDVIRIILVPLVTLGRVAAKQRSGVLQGLWGTVVDVITCFDCI